MSQPMNQQHQKNRQPMRRLQLQLSNPSDSNYLNQLQKNLSTYPGITRCVISKKKGQILIDFDPFTANLPSIRQAIEDSGFKAEPITDREALKSVDCQTFLYKSA